MEVIWLFLAAVMAGALNAVAGGGSFIALPALLFYGLPATAANATNAFAMLPGCFGAFHAFRRDIAAPKPLSRSHLILIAASGGITGAILMLLSGDRVFSAVVPWLMMTATLIFAFSPWIKRLSREARLPTVLAVILLYLICSYGGYFNGGAGIIIIALLG